MKKSKTGRAPVRVRQQPPLLATQAKPEHPDDLPNMAQRGSDKKPISTPEVEPARQTTLADFIEENHKLLTVWGVFNALVVFASNVKISGISAFLTFTLMGMIVLVLIELMVRLQALLHQASYRLRLFEYLLGVSTLFVLLYWLLEQRRMWAEILFGVVTSLLLILIIHRDKRPPRKAPRRELVMGAVLGLVTIALGVLTLDFPQVFAPVNSAVGGVLDNLYDTWSIAPGTATLTPTSQVTLTTTPTPIQTPQVLSIPKVSGTPISTAP